MVNQTMAERVVRETTDVNPIEGYAIVVFEQVGSDGREFQATIYPKQRFEKKKKKLFGPAPSYFAYAVKTDPKLKLKFAHRVLHKNQVNAFDLTFSVDYHVADPRLMVEHLSSDPLKRLQDEIKHVVARAISGVDWSWIERDFDELERTILAADGEVLHRIGEFASNLGIEVKTIELERRLTEDILKPAVAEKDARVEKRVREIQQGLTIHQKELDQQLKERENKEALRRLEAEKSYEMRKRQLNIDIESQFIEQEHGLEYRKQMHKMKLESQQRVLGSFITAVENLAQGTENSEEFRRNAEAVLQIVQGVFENKSLSSATNGEGGNPMLKAATAASIGALPPAAGGTAHLLFEVVKHVNQLSSTSEDKNRLLSAILHLIAELLLGEEADKERVEHYGETVKTLAVKLRPMPREQFQFLHDLQNYDLIKNYLK